jgi:hypothetical protein
VSRYTAADLLGELLPVSPRHAALGDDYEDECNECGGSLRRARTVFLADCGRYCSRRCAESHAAMLADEMNRRAADDRAQGGTDD